MKLRVQTIICTCLCFLNVVVYGGNIVLQGAYQGEDLYIRNETAPDGVGFCITKISVNGITSTDEINSHALIVDLKVYEFNIGDPVEIIIEHKDGCEPFIVNPEILEPVSSFEVEQINLTEAGVLEWSTVKESGKLPYYIEQRKWNKWVTMAEIQGLGEKAGNEYRLTLDLHSGENVIRLKQKDRNGNRYSDEIRVVSETDPVSIAKTKVKSQIDFSASTHFEVYNEFGVLVKKGFGKSVDVSILEKGTYYINFDNQAGIPVEKR